MIVDLNTGSTAVLPVTTLDAANGISAPSRNKSSDGPPHFTPTAACFNKFGDLVYVGNSKGEILIVDHENAKVHAMVSISGGAVIKNIVFSRNGQYLLTNSNDRTIRIYENLLPLKGGLAALEDLNRIIDGGDGIEKLKAVGSKCLALFREFQDSITKMHWKAPCFSGDGEWVIGGSASKGEHKIYIWDRAGHLVKILEGPKEALIDLAWHPVHPIVVSVSLTGLVYIWAKDYTENWSAFAPDFKELEENEEYVEREDEFDLIPETEKVKESDVNEDDEVDIVTVEKDTFSDSDMSQEELCFLPVVPCPDIPEQQDKCMGSTSKLLDCNGSGSPLSDEAGQNEQAMNHSSSPLDEDTGGTRIRRKRKPSEKGLELQAELVRKPSKPLKSTGRLSSKVKSKQSIYHRKLLPPKKALGADDCAILVGGGDDKPQPPPIPKPVRPLGTGKTEKQKDIIVTGMTIVSCVVGGALLVFIFYLVLRSYISRRRRRRNTRTLSAPIIFGSPEDFSSDEFQSPAGIIHPIWYINTVGLPQSVIESISVFQYKKGQGLIEDSTTECSVCLSEFEEDESLRLLPKCSHAFHLPCIDTWLRSHKNCPLCRAPVVSDTSLNDAQAANLSQAGTSDLGSAGAEESLVEDGENNNMEMVRYETGGGGDGTEEGRDGDGDDSSVRIENQVDRRPILRDHNHAQTDLVNKRQAVEDEMQAMRRSVSLDSCSGIAIYGAVSHREAINSPATNDLRVMANIVPGKHVGNSDSLLVRPKRSKLKNSAKRGGSVGNVSFHKLAKNAGIGLSLQKKVPISMKRSISSGGKSSSSSSTQSKNKKDLMRSF
ncbi:hypothetical protein Tsubulata_011952, partial [Turnera subulata]